MSDRDQLIGVRPHDLTEAEREAQRALFEADPDALREHEEALALGRELAALPRPAAGPTMAQLRERLRARETVPDPDEEPTAATDRPEDPLRVGTPAERGPTEMPSSVGEPLPERAPANRNAWPWIALLAVAAATLLVVVGGDPRDPMRDRGASAGPGEVRIEAVVEGPGAALRPVASGAEIAPGERVAFRVHTTGQGYLAIDEVDGGGRLYPTSDAGWQVGAGTHVMGGEASPLTYRPDAGTGRRRYVARYCTEPPPAGACSTHEIVLEWAE